MNFKEHLEAVIEKGYKGKNNTCNGKCSKCGECCGIVLPLDQEDVDRIQEYVFKNKIFINKFMLVMRQKLQCPYYKGGEKGCSIYEARPKICKYYICNKKAMNMEEYSTMGKTYAVDMWDLAQDIEKEMIKYYGLNKETRKAIK